MEALECFSFYVPHSFDALLSAFFGHISGVTYLCFWKEQTFCPILGFSFITLDVSPQLLDNPHVHGLTVQNVKHILTSPCIASYYPVRSLTFALDYEIWGLDPTGFNAGRELKYVLRREDNAAIMEQFNLFGTETINIECLA